MCVLTSICHRMGFGSIETHLDYINGGSILVRHESTLRLCFRESGIMIKSQLTS